MKARAVGAFDKILNIKRGQARPMLGAYIEAGDKIFFSYDIVCKLSGKRYS